MVDYPRDRAEAWAFSRYGKTINCHFEIYEIQEPVDLDTKDFKEVAGTSDEEELKHLHKVEEHLAELRFASQNSAKNAPIRDMAFVRVPYCDAEQVELKTNDEGEAATNVMPAEQAFMKAFLKDYIETYAAYLYHFMTFKSKVEINQLMPEKAVMEELSRLRKSRQQFQFWKADQEATIDEIKNQVLTDGQKEQMTEEQLEEFETQKAESLQQLQHDLDTQLENDRQSQERIAELRKLAQTSLDEHREPDHFDDSIYQKDFIQHAELKNQVSSILSAMVSQVERENQAS